MFLIKIHSAVGRHSIGLFSYGWTDFADFWHAGLICGEAFKSENFLQNRGCVTSNGLFWPQKSTLLCLAVNFDIKHTIF